MYILLFASVVCVTMCEYVCFALHIFLDHIKFPVTPLPLKNIYLLVFRADGMAALKPILMPHNYFNLWFPFTPHPLLQKTNFHDFSLNVEYCLNFLA